MKKKDFIEKNKDRIASNEEKELAQFVEMMEEQMARANITGFINGVFTTGQAMSENMGFSSLAISVSLADRYLQDFAAQTKAKELPKMYESELSLKEELGAILDGADKEPKIGATVSGLLENVAGKDPKVYRFKEEAQVKENASGYSKGWGPFYFMEDMFYAVFDDIAVLVMVGNDE